ncbi:hypothetical protein D9M69_586170 [compost metagenome]
MKTFTAVNSLSGLMTKLSSPVLMPAVVFPSRLLLPMPMPDVLTFMFAVPRNEKLPPSISASVRSFPSSSSIAGNISPGSAVALTPKKTISSDGEGMVGGSCFGISNVRTGSGPPAAREPSALLRTTVELNPCTRSSA